MRCRGCCPPDAKAPDIPSTSPPLPWRDTAASSNLLQCGPLRWRAAGWERRFMFFRGAIRSQRDVGASRCFVRPAAGFVAVLASGFTSAQIPAVCDFGGTLEFSGSKSVPLLVPEVSDTTEKVMSQRDITRLAILHTDQKQAKYELNRIISYINRYHLEKYGSCK